MSLDLPARHTQKPIIQFELTVKQAGPLIDLLVAKSGLSKRKIKEVMQKGAVWLRKGKGKMQRIRKASVALRVGDSIEFYYDETILERTAPAPKCLWRHEEYSVWFKPAGLLSQGNQFGDHLSLLRLAQLQHPLRKPVYMVHRLDREAQGLVLLAHNKTAARHLSQLFQRQQIDKKYRVIVKGKTEQQGLITSPLDGKTARSEYYCESYDADTDTSTLAVTIHSGRTHQIRRHLNMINHPVMGDPRYGRGNKADTGLALTAII